MNPSIVNGKIHLTPNTTDMKLLRKAQDKLLIFAGDGREDVRQTANDAEAGIAALLKIVGPTAEKVA